MGKKSVSHYVADDSFEGAPEIRLWRAVVDRAVHDATWREYYPTYANRNKTGEFEIKDGYFRVKEAVSYITSNRKDFSSIKNLTSFTGHNLERIKQFVNMEPLEYVKLKEKYDVIKYKKARDETITDEPKEIKDEDLQS